MAGVEQDELPYKWDQTLAEVSVEVVVPEGKKARDLVIKIEKEKLLVKLKSGEVYIDGELHKPVKVQDCLWTKDGNVISIDLQKANKMEWWACVIKGHPEIDTSKIAPENSNLSDLDGETKGMVQKMMFDQRQKAAGLPTSDDMEKQEAIQKFMAAHPEMDFSNAKIN
mmetsp:Transcript_13036/g.16325  ORF Transcript_13036/g.16325 Transcript_13036/m.16325 type:complete len:168 (-) Transcript_13036:34-537(-)